MSESSKIHRVLTEANTFFNAFNEEKTRALREDEDYKQFLKWFTDNGGKFDNIEYPACFGPSGYLGIKVQNSLEAHKVIICIPNHIIITTKLVRNSELAPIIAAFPDLFEEEENPDADFNILSLFVLYEKVKGKDSFYYHWFNTTKDNFSMYGWSEKELINLDDPCVKDYAEEFQNEINREWYLFKKCIKQFPDFFPKDKYSKELYLWSFEYVMTRCYGWSLKYTSLIPLADCLNHSPDAVDHCSIDTIKEKDPSVHDLEYTVKRDKINLDVLGIPGNKVYDHWRQRVLKTFQEDIPSEDQYQIYNARFDISSDSEDNDSSSEESEEGEENKKKLKVFDKFRTDEIEKSSNISKEKEKEIFFEEKEIKPEEDDLDDEEWDWYDAHSKEQYFVMSSTRPMKNNEQLYNCYGRRSNKFLVLWYGFVLLQNKYDSFSFRMVISQNTKFSDDVFISEEFFRNIYFTAHIPMKDGEKRAGYQIKHNGKVYEEDEISKEFKLKRTSFPLELFDFFRLNYITNCKDYKLKKSIISIPHDLDVELKIIKFFQEFIAYIMRQKKTTVEKDLKELEGMKTRDDYSANDYFGCIYRVQQKEILIKNQELFKILELIVLSIKEHKDIKKAYLQQFDFETDYQEYINNRIILKEYFRYLQVGLLI